MADNVISVQVVADANSVAATFEQMLANVRRSLDAVRAEVRKTSAELQIAAPEERNGIRQALNAMKWDSSTLEASLHRVAGEWAAISDEIKGALRQYIAFADTASERRIGSGFPNPPEQRAAAQIKVDEASARLASAIDRAQPLLGQTQVLETKAKESAAAPGAALLNRNKVAPAFEESGGQIHARLTERGVATLATHPEAQTHGAGLLADAEWKQWQQELSAHGITSPHQVVARAHFTNQNFQPNLQPNQLYPEIAYVDEEWRRQGIARRLYDEAERAQSAATGAPATIVPSRARTSSADAFWENRAERFPEGLPEAPRPLRSYNRHDIYAIGQLPPLPAPFLADTTSTAKPPSAPPEPAKPQTTPAEIAVIQHQAQENVEAAKVVGETIATATQNGAHSLDQAFTASRNSVTNGSNGNNGSNGAGGNGGGGGKPPGGPPPLGGLPSDDNEEERSQKAARDAAIGIANDNSIKSALDQKRDEYTRSSAELQTARKELESFSRSIPQNLPADSGLKKIQDTEAARVSDLEEKNRQLRQELTALEKQYRAVTEAQDATARSAQRLTALQREIASRPPKTSEEAEGFRLRAQAEDSAARSALRNAQTVLGGESAAGSKEADAAIQSLQQNVVATSQVVSEFRDREDQLADAEKKAGEAADQAGAGIRGLAGANNAAQAQSKRLADIQDEVRSRVGASAADLQGLYVRAATEARLATSNLEQAQKFLGPAAAAGSKEAAAAMVVLENAMKAADAEANELKARITLLARAEAEATEATMAEARAQVEAKIAKAGSAEAALKLANAEGQAARGSSNLFQRMQEGRIIAGTATGSVGALEFAFSKLAAVSKTLGPIIDAAFVPFAVIGLGELIVDVAGKVKKLYQNFVELKEMREATEQVELKLAKATEQAFEEEKKLNVEILRQQGKNVEAAELERQNLESKPIDIQPFLSDKELEKQFKQLPDSAQKALQHAFGDIVPTDLGDKIKEVTQRLNEAHDAAEKLRKTKAALDANPAVNANAGGGPNVLLGLGRLTENLILQRETGKQEVPEQLYGGLLQYLKQQEPVVKEQRQLLDNNVLEQKGRQILKDTQEREDSLKIATSTTGVLPPPAPTETTTPTNAPFVQTPGGPSSLPPGTPPIPPAIPLQTPAPSPGSLSLPQAIARLEGFGASLSNIPTKNNNPGDITFGKFAQSYGATPGSESSDPKTGEKHTIANFPDPETGFKAMQDLLQSSEYKALTLAEAITKWQGSTEHIQEASRLTGIAPNAPIAPSLGQGSTQNPETQVQLAETTIKLRQQALDQIKALGLQPGNPVYDEAENKLAAASGGVQNKIAAELRRADQDQLSEMRLKAEETHKDHAQELAEEAAFIRSRLDAERAYIANRKELRTELVAVLKAQEQGRISKETKTASDFVTDEGKPDYNRRLNYWNQIAADAEGGSQEYLHALDEAKHTGAEAIRQTSEELKKADETGLEDLKRQHIVSIQEEVNYWQARIKAEQIGGAGAAEALEAANDKLAAATQRLLEQQRDIKRIQEEISRLKVDSKFDQEEEVVRGAHELHVPAGALGKELGVPLPQVQRPSIGTDIASLGGSLGEGTHEAQETAAIHRQQYESDRQYLEQKKALYSQDSREYAELQQKEAQLDLRYDRQKLQDTVNIARQMTQVWTHEIEQISQAFFRGLNQWITGQKTFTQAMKQAWKDMVTSIIQDIEKWITKMIEEAVIMAVVKKILATIGLDTGGKGNSQAQKQIAQNDTEKESYLDLATAIAFEAEMAKSDGNVVAAAAVAAVAHALGEVVSAPVKLDTGGYTQADGMAMLHQGEVVISNPVTKMLEQMATTNAFSDRGNITARNPAALMPHGGSPAPVTNLSQVSNSSSRGDIHNTIHYAPNVTNGDTRDFRSMLETHKDEIGRIVHRQSKTFNRG